MVAIGFLLFAAAVVVAAVLVLQNQGGTPVQVHALGHTWMLHQYWILTAGAILAFTAVIGVKLMCAGAACTRRLRHERDELLAENNRLNGRSPDPQALPFFSDVDAPQSWRAGGDSSAGLFRGTREGV